MDCWIRFAQSPFGMSDKLASNDYTKHCSPTVYLTQHCMASSYLNCNTSRSRQNGYPDKVWDKSKMIWAVGIALLTHHSVRGGGKNPSLCVYSFDIRLTCPSLSITQFYKDLGVPAHIMMTANSYVLVTSARAKVMFSSLFVARFVCLSVC